MGIIFQSDTFAQNPAAPATHVLLVGCGEYPGLKAQNAQQQPMDPPRLSVEAMAEWFLSGPDAMPGEAGVPERAFYNPQAPLGTVAMLVSPSQDYILPSGAVATCTRPTRANLEQAFRDWLVRLGDNPKSRGIFYFCGHGLSDGETQYMLADDVLEDRFEPWKPAVHVKGTCDSASRNTAATLAFWIDACAEFSQDILNRLRAPGPLLDGARTGQPKTVDWSIMPAAAMNRQAFAPESGVARFTEALLRALRGFCGTQYEMDTYFSVAATDLYGAVSDFLALKQRDMAPHEKQLLGGLLSGCASTTALHVLEHSPMVHVEVDIDPIGFRPVTSAFMQSASQARELKALGNGPASFQKAKGEWTYGALASQAQFPEQAQSRLLTRAVLSWQFRVTQQA
jgi:hypothetical protein